ncbi:NADH:flavin oxidoreductase/NADH oxidase [uncultured Sanguibacteroides sp.]|uniref:NADH:flavin oxidoreductase/NADH oxidase n=1 Tax=uncultured Sanguibacteroides sp. TaxID=1635151 RepID=UPI0025FFC9FD|nr:NADH:flavin oxidoreductase/NADH oxidase [uncultured Sanguibacteroides sp.]
MSALFTPLTLKSVTLRNRIVLSPMCQYSAQDGFADNWHLVHYGSRAVGGAGLVLVEATAISPEGRITPDDLGLWRDEHVEKLKTITDFITEQGAVPGIQLAHAGRKASTLSEWKGKGKFLKPAEGGWRTVAPSPIAYLKNHDTPQALTAEGIHKVITDFTDAARRAIAAGFKVIEIHAAHGYLLHEFLSPLTNHREDLYGGSFENRIRLLLEVVNSIRKVIRQEIPLLVRISATDWEKGGWDPEQSVQLASILSKIGVDLLDVSSGGLIANAEIPIDYGYQLPFASIIQRKTSMRTGSVGMLTDPIQMETILRTGETDLIIIGRELLRDPYFPLHAAERLNEKIVWPVQYQRARPIR